MSWCKSWFGDLVEELGIRTGGEEGRQLLGEAVAAYRAALEVRTKDSLAPQWAQTHNNLAEALLALGDWEQVVVSYTNVLELYPDYADAYSTTNAVLYEKLFRYGETFAWNQQWLAAHPDDEPAKMNFAQAHLTTGHFAEAEQRLTEIVNTSEPNAHMTIPLRVLRLASLVGQQKMTSVSGPLQEMMELLGKQPEDFSLSWSFEGTKHFIGQDEAFVGSREWLLPLFEVFGGKPRDEMLAAVENAQAHLSRADPILGRN